MNVDKIEFEEALSVEEWEPIEPLVEMSSIVRQSAVRFAFDPGDDGLTRYDLDDMEDVICQNQFGGSSREDVENEHIFMHPNALSVVFRDIPPTILSSMISMKEEISLKRFLDGANLDNEILIEYSNRDKMMNEIDKRLSRILKDIGCSSNSYAPHHCPLILFDAAMLTSSSIIRKFSMMGNRIPDAMASVEDHKCPMFAFPGFFKKQGTLFSSEGVDDAPEFMSMYVFESESLHMMTSNIMWSKFLDFEDDLGMVSWVTGFVIPFVEKVHRIKVRSKK